MDVRDKVLACNKLLPPSKSITDTPHFNPERALYWLNTDPTKEFTKSEIHACGYSVTVMGPVFEWGPSAAKTVKNIILDAEDYSLGFMIRSMRKGKRSTYTKQRGGAMTCWGKSCKLVVNGCLKRVLNNYFGTLESLSPDALETEIQVLLTAIHSMPKDQSRLVKLARAVAGPSIQGTPSPPQRIMLVLFGMGG